MSDERDDAVERGTTDRTEGRQNAMTHEQAAGPDPVESNEAADRRARVVQPDGSAVEGFGQDHPVETADEPVE